MQSRFWLVGVGVAALLAAASPTNAGGNSVAITGIQGKVEIRPVQSGGHW